jgi:hypothetical protein
MPWWFGMLAGGAVIYAVARYIGKPVAAGAVD